MVQLFSEGLFLELVLQDGFGHLLGFIYERDMYGMIKIIKTHGKNKLESIHPSIIVLIIDIAN